MIDRPTDISKDCQQTSQIFAQVAVVLNLTGQNGPQNGHCFDSSTDDQIDVFGNVFFNYRTIGSRTCNKKATHIPVSILIILRLNSHNLSTNWVVTAEDVLSVVRFAGSACGHFPVYASNMKPSVWWNNEVKSTDQVNSNFVSVLHNRIISCDCHASQYRLEAKIAALRSLRS